MTLRFLAIDPRTNGENCPSVWLDDTTGDLLLQGWEVTDQDTLAEINMRSPIAANEKVVRLPARMRAMVQEACGDGTTDL